MYIYIIYSLFVIILLVILLLYIGIWSINSKIHSKITENNDAKIVDFSEDKGHFTGNFTGKITSNIEIILKINSKIKENGNENDRDFNKETNEILSKIKNKENENSKIREFNIIFNNEIKKILSDFIDDDISIFINNKNKDKFFKDFDDSCKDKKRDFKNNFSNITVSLFTGIGNNMNVYIVEVPNETAPSIQGFAKPPA